MRKKRLTITITGILSFHFFMMAQAKREPTIPFETLFGNERAALSMSMNKSISGNIDGYRPGRPTIQNYGGFIRIDI